MSSVKAALALGLALTTVAIGVVLSRAPLTVVGANAVVSEQPVAVVDRHTQICEHAGTVPQGTSEIRASLTANVGPSVSVSVLSGTRVVSHGERASGWGADETVTVPVARVSHTISHAIICTVLGPTGEGVVLDGESAPPAPGYGQPAVRLRLEYLRPASRSWWSRVSTTVEHLGFAHATGGTWLTIVVLALMLILVVLVSWTVSREAAVPDVASASELTRAPPKRMAGVIREIPGAAWLCAMVALLNAVCWSVITPPFQAPDEPSHFAYTQQLAETGRLPTSHSAQFAQEENVILRDMHQSEVRGHPEIIPISSTEEQRRLEHDLSLHLRRVGVGAAGVATSEPPLYYLLETLPYKLGSSGTLLDQLALMRLFSAFMGALAALFAYMFVREALPAVPRAWTIGGLCVALAPLLGFMSGAVNPDSMLFAVSCAIFYCLARGFRRGLTQQLAIAIGVLMAIGLLTKVNFIGLLPGVVLGLTILTLRASPTRRIAAFRSLGLALMIGASPVCAYLIINLLSNHAELGVASRTFNGASEQTDFISHELSYIWQFYLPRLPGMTSYFPGLFTARDVWFDRWVGLYGWLDTSFPVWVYNIARLPAALIALLWLRAMVTNRAELRARLPELAVYTVMGAGLMTLIAAIGYISRNISGAGYAQPRYLLPLLPLLAGIVALATRGAGRRWGPAMGALLVVLLLAHDIFSQLLVVSRYYV